VQFSTAQHFRLVPAILHQRLVITYNSILKASFITPSSESMSLLSLLVADGHSMLIDPEVVLKMVIGEMSDPLSSVGAGCQALPVCQLLSTAWGFKALLAQLLVIAFTSTGFLEVANLNVNGRDLLIEISEVADVSGDTPIVELSSRCNHGKELGVRAVDNAQLGAVQPYDMACDSDWPIMIQPCISDPRTPPSSRITHTLGSLF
jgi:hypothetical protein